MRRVSGRQHESTRRVETRMASPRLRVELEVRPIMSDTQSDPRYPVGKFHRPTGPHTAGERRTFIEQIAATPARLRAAVSDLSEAQLETPYRDGGWTVRQVVHHVPDS